MDDCNCEVPKLMLMAVLGAVGGFIIAIMVIGGAMSNSSDNQEASGYWMNGKNIYKLEKI